MKYSRILDLAHTAALSMWHETHLKIEELNKEGKTSETLTHREQKRWKELMQIEALIRAENE